MILRDYQQEAVDAVMAWVRRSTEPCLVEAATGCHAKGHPILMHDGSIRAVEDISVGDVVMSADGKSPAVVTELHRGVDEMFLVTPVKGESFVVNKGHIFSLYITPARSTEKPYVIDVNLEDYLASNAYFKHRAKLYRSACDFGTEDSGIDTWAIGAIIGDGSIVQGTPTFCSPDDEIVSKLESFAKNNGCHFNVFGEHKTAPTYSMVDPLANRCCQNRIRALLESMGLWGCHSAEKFVPAAIKTGSLNDRLNMLAGLIDTDGHLSRSGYDWISKSKQLADDIVYLCRSVGLAAYKSECTKRIKSTGFEGQYWRVSISGDCSIIPCRLKRKRASSRLQVKNHLVTGFSVKSIGVGEYYGFSIDTHDRLYLDGNFVAHHNSGKSVLVAEIARLVHTQSGKRILCLAPSAELVNQNREKFLLTGNPASIFSASAGGVSLKHPVVFGSPLTVKNKISRFGSDFAMVILDEAHGLTPTIKTIIDTMRGVSPRLRVVGMTATPYRMNDGYIYKVGVDDKPVGGHATRDPYFTKLVYQIGARMLIERGYLTPPTIGQIGSGGYETRHMALNSRGQFDKDDVDRAYHGHGRKTAAIIADIIAQSRDRRGVMIFAATVQHAQECMASLPPGLSAIVTGETPAEERRKIVERFKAQEIKYIVNVSVLTVGFDAPHVDVVALLRATESVGLLQQIIGRGLRLCDGKDDCLLLDYAENIDRHCPDGDVFDPKISSVRSSGESVYEEFACEVCGTMNQFKLRPNTDGFKIDENGYFLDLDGERIQTEHGYIPAHYGRRCQGLHRQSNGTYAQCHGRWTFKECPHCGAENDIAARYCSDCRGEIVDPGEKLRIEFKALKRDPTRMQTDELLDWVITESVSRTGNETWKIDWTTPYRTFTTWTMKNPNNNRAAADHSMLLGASQNLTVMPVTVTYRKDPETGFYRIHAFNREADREPQ